MEGVNCAVALLIYTILHYEGAPDQNLRKVMYALFSTRDYSNPLFNGVSGEKIVLIL